MNFSGLHCIKLTKELKFPNFRSLCHVLYFKSKGLEDEGGTELVVISLSEIGLDEQNLRKVSFAGRRGDDWR